MREAGGGWLPPQGTPWGGTRELLVLSSKFPLPTSFYGNLAFMMRTLKKRKQQDQDRDDLDFRDDGRDIIQALNDMPPPPVTDWQYIPIRGGRPELHVTGPRMALPPPLRPQPTFVSRARLIRLWKDRLPLFRGAAHLLGFRAFMPVPRPRVKGHPALSLPPGPWLHTVSMYCDKTLSVVCSQYEAARAELFDDARAYDIREQRLRSQRPLSV